MKSSAAAQALTPSPIHYLYHHRRFNPNPCSASMPRPPNRRRRHRRRTIDPTSTTSITTIPADNKPSFYTSSDADNFQATLDLNSLYLSSHSRFRRLISSAAEAVEDLQTFVSLDPHNRVVLSCRPATLHFVGNFALFSCAALLVGLRVLLRQICMTSGVRVTDKTNTPDSLNRVFVDFVLNICSRALSNSTTVEIEEQDAQQFIAGLADIIGLDNVRAARIVTAAVAARTRSYFLQAWVLFLLFIF